MHWIIFPSSIECTVWNYFSCSIRKQVTKNYVEKILQVGRFKCFFPLLAGLVFSLSLSAQDPSFSQFFSSPLNVNPALTGNINGQWRVISNLRSQWAGPAYPYNTGTISFDMKLLKNKLPENSILGIGGMMMYDKVMGGVLKSNYASLNGSYNCKLQKAIMAGLINWVPVLVLFMETELLILRDWVLANSLTVMDLTKICQPVNLRSARWRHTSLQVPASFIHSVQSFPASM